MIGPDRIELNERFKVVFNALEDRGEIIKNDRNGRGVGDFAEKILGKRTHGHIIRDFLDPDKNRWFDYKYIQPLCKHYGVSRRYMRDGLGTPFGSDYVERPTDDARPMNGGGRRGNIVFTTAKAFAGSGFASDSFNDEGIQTFSIPEIHSDNMYAFYIQGNSMEPVINNNELVLCQYIDDINRIRDNEIYAVVHDGTMWVKYVQCVRDKQRRVRRLKLISENKLEHDPFEEEVNQTTRVYRVMKRLADV